MSAERVALRHYRARRRLIRAVAKESRQAWRRVDPTNIVGSWRAELGRLLVVLAGAQLAAAESADGYLTEVLAAQGIDPAAEGRLVASTLSGVASDGRDLAGLLYQPAVTSLVAIGQGADVRRALAGGYASLDMIVRTQVADAGRAADAVVTAARPGVTGYRRMVVGKTCGRCVVLAGKWYRYNAGFDRHPRCDCVHVPAREDTADAIQTNPRAWFDSLTPAEQDKQFTKAGAESIRLGADISQVVNARRGAYGLTPAGARITAAEAKALRNGLDRGHLQTRDVFGHQLYTTTEGVTTRGQPGIRLGAKESGEKVDGGRYRSARPPRLMPESILQIAGNDRNEAVRLLRRFGYLT